MNTPLITDEKDPKWVLLGKIIGIVSSRRVKQEMAKQGDITGEPGWDDV